MPHQEPLGPQYRGSRIGRDNLFAGESDISVGGTDSSDGDEAPDEDGDVLDQEDLALWDEGASKPKQGVEKDESDKSDKSEVLGEIDQAGLESSSLKRGKPSGLPGKENFVEMEDIDASGASDEGPESEDEGSMSIEGGSMDVDASFKIDDADDAFDDEASGVEADSSSDEASSEPGSGSSSSNGADPNDMDERATLRQMMAESQKAVVAKITEASKVDVAKGQGIAHQRGSFNALLNTRVHLQQGIIAMNSLTFQDAPTLDATMASVISNAEAAALRLWNGLEELRQAIQPSTPPPTKKRLVSPATRSTSTAAMWDQMQGHEAQSIPTRRATLTKWSSRLQPVAVDRGRSTLSGTSNHTPLMTVLDQHLAGPNRARLLAKTRIPRSCAPTQAAAHISSDPEIYDDADFYTTLLREFVDRRMTDSSFGLTSGSGPHSNESNNNPAASSSLLLLPLARDRKPRGQVDTRASKGRKMRYAVHEKLQNFMAPEDRGSWGERQTRELFAGLLGRKVTLGEEEGDDDDEEGDDMLDSSAGAHAPALTNGHSHSNHRYKNTNTNTNRGKNEEEEDEAEEALGVMFRRRR